MRKFYIEIHFSWLDVPTRVKCVYTSRAKAEGDAKAIWSERTYLTIDVVDQDSNLIERFRE